MMDELSLSKKAKQMAKKVGDLPIHVSCYEANCLRPSELKNAISRVGIPDVLIVDYPALMWSGSVSDPKFTRFAIEANYLHCRNLAQEFGCAVWAPFQANRMGHGTQKSEGDCLGLDNAAEAYGVNRHSDINISWNQTQEEEEQLRGRLAVIKNRGGPKDMVKVQIDWGRVDVDSKSYAQELV